MIFLAIISFSAGFLFKSLMYSKPRRDITEIILPDRKKEKELPALMKAIKKIKVQNQLN